MINVMSNLMDRFYCYPVANCMERDDRSIILIVNSFFSDVDVPKMFCLDV